MKETTPISSLPESIVDYIVKMLVSLNEKNVAFSVLEALGKHAASVNEFNTLAKNFHSIKKYKESYHFVKECLSILKETNDVNAILVAKKNLLQCLNSLNEGEEAINLIESTSKEHPEFYDADTKIQMAFALFIINRKDEAEEILKGIINDRKNNETDTDVAKFNMAAHDFRHGRFQEGLKKFIHYGRKRNTNVKSSLPFSPWVGQTVGIKNIILTAEAGIGDEFVNVRFLNNIIKLGINAYWYTDREEVRRVFGNSGYRCLTKECLGSFSKSNTVVCNAMEAPMHLNLKETELYFEPYIQIPTPVKIKPNNLKIGLRWAGNPEYEHDLQRTIPIQNLFDKIKSPHREFYSLQRDSDMDFVYENYNSIVDLDGNGCLNTLESTMIELADLDIVITSCTSIAHMAASMGVNTWVLPPIAAYYVWSHPVHYRTGLPYHHTNWYGKNVRIFQQRNPKVWDDVFDDVATELDLFQTIGF